jgi:hypothetical protein
MGDTVAGISLPPGNPGSIEDAAQGLKRVASGFTQAGDTARAAASSVSWTGTASEAFGARTGDYEDASRKADTAAMQAAGVLTRFARRLEEGIDRVKRLQDRAQDAQERMKAATDAAIAAGVRESAARTRAAAITVTDILDVTGSSLADQSAALQEADDAAAERVRYEGIADRARDELEQLREEARQEREAVKDAATAAAGELNGAQNGLPVLYHGGMYGTAGAMEDRVLTGVRNGDYSVLEGLDLDTMDEDTQQAVGAEIAKDADQASYNEGEHSFSEVTDVVSQFGSDEDFAVGFYNQLGGAGTATLASSITMFQNTGEGLDDPALVALMAPYANMLGTATTSGGLHRGFTNRFLSKDLSVRDRYRYHDSLGAFVMSGTASRYSPEFLSEVGEEILIAPSANPDDSVPHYELSDDLDMMEFVAENPDAAALLLAGRHGPENHFSNVGPLLLYGPRYTDDGNALGSLIQAGTVTSDSPASITASEMVIKGAPEFGDHMPDGAKTALVNVFDEQVESFEYTAANEAAPTDDFSRPEDGVDISYDEGRDYLSMLLGYEDSSYAGNDEVTIKDQTATVAATQIEQQVYDATGHEQGSDRRNDLLTSSGAFQEMVTQSAIDADISEAEGEQSENKVKQWIAGKAVDVAGGKYLERIPGSDILIDKFKEGVFPTDQVEKALERADETDLDAEERYRHLLRVGEVMHGNLPPEVLKAENLDSGTPSFDLDQDGDENDFATTWDTNGDGRPERLTEEELRNYVGDAFNDEPAQQAQNTLSEIENAKENPAELGDFSDNLPHGYSMENDWLFFGEAVHNDQGHEVDYEITRDRTHYVLTLKDPDGPDVEVRMERVNGEWVPAR